MKSNADAVFAALLAGLIAFGLVSDALELNIETYQKALSFLAILLVGRMLGWLKASVVGNVIGFQQIILSCLLPALLYKSLLGLDTDQISSVCVYIVASFAFTVFLALGFVAVLWATGFSREAKERHTLSMMFAGAAPGLTSLPYIEAVVSNIAPYTVNAGHAGVADLGIKVSVLFIQYLVAFRLAEKSKSKNLLTLRLKGLGDHGAKGSNLQQTLKTLFICFFTEPVNCGSILGITLLAAGPVRLQQQSIWGNVAAHLAACCSPAIFLLVGIKLKLAGDLSLLMLVVFRSGLAFLFTFILSQTIFPADNEIMFWAFFCNAAVSFWPYTHMVKISSLETEFQQQVCQGVFQDVASSSVDVEVRAWFESHADQVRLGKNEMTPAKAIAAAEIVVADAIKTSKDKKSEVAESLQEVERSIQMVKDLETTFNLPLSLMMLGVSFTWTIGLCTLLSLTPSTFWVNPVVLAMVGSGLVLVSSVYLMWHGHRLKADEKQDAEAEAEAQADPEVRPVRASRRTSETLIVEESVEVTPVVLLEAAAALQSQVDREELFGTNNDQTQKLVEHSTRQSLSSIKNFQDECADEANDRLALSVGCGPTLVSGMPGERKEEVVVRM